MAPISNGFIWPFALLTITAYSFNSQVFVWIGSADYGGKLFELFLFHAPASLFLLYFVARGREEARAVLARRGQGSMAWFALQVLVGAGFQMEIYYLWFLASLKIPTQLVAAVFQTAIVIVYVLSILFLRERFSFYKMSAVLLAVFGVIIAIFAGQWFGQSSDAGMPSQSDMIEGVLLALGAEVSKAFYQIWFKASFGEPSPKFAMLFGGLIGVAHFFPILPLIMLLNSLGVHDARTSVSSWSAAQAGLIVLAACIAGAVNVGSLAVVAMRSPVFWSSVQLLAIPISVVFDFIIQGISPNPYNCVGYLVIIVACLMISSAPSSTRDQVDNEQLEQSKAASGEAESTTYNV